jgi:hypothetical protein
MSPKIARYQADPQRPLRILGVVVWPPVRRVVPLDPFPPRLVFLEQRRTIEKTEIIEKKKSLALQIRIVSRARDGTIVSRNRFGASAKEAQLFRNAAVDALIFRIEVAHALQVLECFHMVLGLRSDHRTEHQ